MRVMLTIPHEMVSAETLAAPLEAATRLAAAQVARGKVPSIRDAIGAGVRWRPEPPGEESFDIPSDVLRRKWGDCDDLAPWRAGELRVSGEDPRARAIAVPSGPGKWHAIVRRSDGRIEDPSRWAGMPHKVVPQGIPLIQAMRPGKASLMIGGAGDIRIDTPGWRASSGCPIGYAVHVQGPDRRKNAQRAISRSLSIGQYTGIADSRALSILRSLYRWLCQDQDIHRALQIEGISHHEVGFPCLAALGPLAAAAATAGTIAAVAGPIALGLAKLAGEDTDFGRAMHTIMDITDKVKIFSAVSAGVWGLAQAGIPAAWTQGASRWVELLQSPLAAAGHGGDVPEVANALHWVEKAGASILPESLATTLAPQVLDLIADAKKDMGPGGELTKWAQRDIENAHKLVEGETKKWLESIKNLPGALPPNTDIDKLAKAKATAYFASLFNAPPPPVDTGPGIHAPRTIHDPGPGIHAPRTVTTTPGIHAPRTINPNVPTKTQQEVHDAAVKAAADAILKGANADSDDFLPPGIDALFARAGAFM